MCTHTHTHTHTHTDTHTFSPAGGQRQKSNNDSYWKISEKVRVIITTLRYVNCCTYMQVNREYLSNFN